MGLLVSAAFGAVVGVLWHCGYQATALGIVAALLFLNHLSIWLKG